MNLHSFSGFGSTYGAPVSACWLVFLAGDVLLWQMGLYSESHWKSNAGDGFF